MNNKHTILLVDDEIDILEFLSYNLKSAGYKVYTASNGLEGIKIAKRELPDLILMDVMMPEMDGIEACEEIRKIPELSGVIVAFLTARNEDYSQIAGFDAGGDDYITKPIKPKVLVSRINALIRRKNRASDLQNTNNLISAGSIIIDKERYLIIKDNTEFSLPKKEFELLAFLASKPDRVFSRDNIYSSVWGEDVIVGDRTIDVHIRKIRKKLGENIIKTVKGVGYKFSE